MPPAEIHARLNALTAVARSRRLACDGIFSATVGGSDIDFMTSAERDERHQLMLGLPTFAEEREAAKDRIDVRIAERKARVRSRQSES